MQAATATAAPEGDVMYCRKHGIRTTLRCADCGEPACSSTCLAKNDGGGGGGDDGSFNVYLSPRSVQRLERLQHDEKSIK